MCHCQEISSCILWTAERAFSLKHLILPSVVVYSDAYVHRPISGHQNAEFVAVWSCGTSSNDVLFDVDTAWGDFSSSWCVGAAQLLDAGDEQLKSMAVRDCGVVWNASEMLAPTTDVGSSTSSTSSSLLPLYSSSMSEADSSSHIIRSVPDASTHLQRTQQYNIIGSSLNRVQSHDSDICLSGSSITVWWVTTHSNPDPAPSYPSAAFVSSKLSPTKFCFSWELCRQQEGKLEY